jgi:hypothetical protein
MKREEGTKNFVVPRKVPRKRTTTRMNIASFFVGKGRRLSQREECDAHFASANVAKSTQRCVFDDDDVLFIPLPLKTSFFPLCCEHKKGEKLREKGH